MTSRRRDTLAGLALAGLFAIVVWTPILAGLDAGSEAFDARTYHLPVIRVFAETWPLVDLRDYQSATTPGYHWLLAAFARATDGDARLLRLAGSLFTLGLLLAAWRVTRRRATPLVSLALMLPVLASSYTLGSAWFNTTDNAGLLFVVLALGGVLATPVTPVRAGLAATGAVLVRQIHLWLIAPIGLAVLLDWRDDQGRAVPRLIAHLAPLLLPIAAVGGFVWLWGGLTPPSFADQHGGGFNFAPIAVALALYGAYGLILNAAVRGPWCTRATVFSAVGAGVLATLMPTSFDKDAGRWGGAIWEVVRHTPDIADRSVILVLGAAVGGLMLARLLAAARAAGHARPALLLLAANAAWIIAQCANTQAWQRYTEPFVLISLAWWMSMSGSEGRRTTIAATVLAAAIGGLTVVSLLR